MKRILLTITALMCMFGAKAQGNDEPIPDIKPNAVDIDLTDQDVNFLSEADMADSSKVTKLIRTYIKDIPDVYYFKEYRHNTDIMGYSHFDCQQRQFGLDGEVDGCEIIFHVKDGKVKYITGDLYKESPAQAKSKKLTPKAKAKVDRGEIVSIRLNGKLRECYVERTAKAIIYKDIYTDEVLKTESTVRNFDDCHGAHKLSADSYYYQKQYMKNDTIVCAMDADGNYVMQDTIRKVYTFDYTSVDNDEPQIWSNQNAPSVSFKTFFRFGQNVKSKDPDFSKTHDSLITYIDTIHFIDNVGLVAKNGYNLDSLHFELYRCKTADITYDQDSNMVFNDAVAKGEQLVSVDGIDKKDSTVFFNIPQKAIRLAQVSRERDTENDFENTFLYFKIFHKNEPMYDGVYPTIHNSYSFLINKEDSTYFEQKSSSEKCQPAIDVHWGLERIIDMYKTDFGMNSFDNKGTPVVALVNHGIGPNAGAYPSYPIDASCGLMVYGMGTVTSNSPETMFYMHPVVAIEVAGHEFTHLVAQKLVYQNETGALNESYADIMGKKIERLCLGDHSYASGDDYVNYVSWRLGQLVGGGTPQSVIRNLENPHLCGDPSCYNGEDWLDYFKTHKDNGGVHINSGVQNHWFYLLCEGGTVTPEVVQSGTPQQVTVQKIDRDKAELITFGSLMYCGLKYLDYATARKNSIRIAEMYYGKDSQEVLSVKQAWYAVGVGTDWDPTPTIIEGFASTVNGQQSTAIYDLSGRYVGNAGNAENLPKGIYIVNGKKYLNR